MLTSSRSQNYRMGSGRLHRYKTLISMASVCTKTGREKCRSKSGGDVGSWPGWAAAWAAMNLCERR